MALAIKNAIKETIKQRYPHHRVYDYPMKQGAKTPCFFVYASLSEVNQKLLTSREYELDADIVYIPPDNDKVWDKQDKILEVQEQLTRLFQYVTVGSKVYKSYQYTATNEDMTAKVRFKIKYIELDQEAVDKMQTADMNYNLKIQGGR